MSKSMLRILSKAMGPNTALVFITVFGSHSTVMVCSARTKRLIATIHRSTRESLHDEYKFALVQPGGGETVYPNLESVVAAIKLQPGYVEGRNRNYSKTTYKEAWL